MLLAEVALGSKTTQRFGKAVAAVASREPPMWYAGQRAYWVKFSGSTFWPHFHPGVDESAAEGTAFIAREAGTVTLAGYHNGISGNVVRVEIRPGVSRYGGNHFHKVVVRPGQKVVKGQKLAEIGHSGATTGNHTHTYVEIYEKGIGWVCYNPDLFIPGGAMQNDPRIQPVASAVQKLVTVKGPGINIRLSPDLDVGLDNLFASSRVNGIFARNGARLSANMLTRFGYIADVSSDDGIFVKVTGFNRILYIYKSLVNIT